MSDWISPYTWPEILRKFPINHATARYVDGEIPAGRIVRELDDLAGQYGDLLEHGDTFFRKPGNVMFFSAAYTSAASTSFTVGAGGRSGTTTAFTFPTVVTASN